MSAPRTLFDKIWDSHLVDRQEDGTCLIYIDRHLVHEVTSPQAFEGLRLAGRKVRHPEATLAVPDHNVPTTDRSKGIADEESRIQVETLEKNCADFGVPIFGMNDPRQGIVHIIGPEQGFTLPGMTIVCGDSHTATHGAFGALAFGIGTSEVEHVLATQTLIQQPAKNLRITVDGDLPLGVTAKDLILAIIGKIGTAGGTGYVIEYAGQAIRDLSMEGRMTVCNMSIEGGARAGLIAPDETTYDYIKGRPYGAQGGRLGAGDDLLAQPALRRGRALRQGSDPRGRRNRPAGDLGHQPGRRGATITGARAQSGHRRANDGNKRQRDERALDYMGLTADMAVTEVSRSTRSSSAPAPTGASRICARPRQVAKGRKVAAGRAGHDRAGLRPGEGSGRGRGPGSQIFTEAGFEWREPGCSMCLAMNADRLQPGERCASTSNRNFEGRQGRGDAPTWSAPVWRRRRRSPAISPTCAISSSATCRCKAALWSSPAASNRAINTSL